MSAPAKVLVLGNYRQTLTVIRSLARAGHTVVRGSGGYRELTQFCRYAAETWQHPDIESEPQAFSAALIALLKSRPDIGYVFPIGETEAVELAACRASLPDSVGVVMPAPAITATCLSKSQSYALAARLGLPLARTEYATSPEDLRAAIGRVGYPCVIKPDTSLLPFFGEKVLIVDSAARLAELLPRWPEGNASLIVQEFVGGYRHNCNFVAWQGRVIAYFEERVLRTERADYTGYTVECLTVAPDPQRRDYCVRLVRELNYSGPGLAQFLVDDARGRTSFLEINPRLSANCAVVYYHGSDQPRLALECARAERGDGPVPAPLDVDYPVGRRGVWALGQVREIGRGFSAGRLRFATALRRLAATAWLCLRADSHTVWEWRDPLPALFELASTAWDVLRSLPARRRHRAR